MWPSDITSCWKLTLMHDPQLSMSADTLVSQQSAPQGSGQTHCHTLAFLLWLLTSEVNNSRAFRLLQMFSSVCNNTLPEYKKDHWTFWINSIFNFTTYCQVYASRPSVACLQMVILVMYSDLHGAEVVTVTNHFLDNAWEGHAKSQR